MPATSRKPAPKRVDRHRRRHARYRCDFQVTVTHLSGGRYEKFEGHGRDLSEAGIGILLAADLSSGEVAGLSFLLPGSPGPWELRAVVRYRSGYQYGFEFLSLPAEQRELLRQFLQSQKPID
jgi:c-di-GMP-binding flagellar brake protein YcgR